MPRKTRRAQMELTLAEANQSSRSGFVSGLNIDLNRINEEYVPALTSWPARMLMYQRMGNDAKIAAILRANQLPLISAVRWKAEGGADESRELLASNILRQGDPRFWCDTSFTQRLFEMAQSLQYGISLFGKVPDIVDGVYFYRSLPYLSPKSLGGTNGPFEWSEDGTRLVAIHRSYKLPGGKGQVQDERWPIDAVFPVVWNMVGENWEGVPMIRSMYRAFTEKDIAAKIQMIDLQNRGVGIPKGKLAPGDGPKAAETMTQILKDMRGGSKERAFILEADGQEIKFLTSEGGTLDAGPILADKNNEFAAGGGTDFQQQGQTTSGSRATGSVLMVDHMQQLDATRQIFEDQINHGCGNSIGLCEELQLINFGPQEEYARIVGTRVNSTDQLDNVSNIIEAIQKGGLTHDLSIENYIRKSQGIETLTAAEFDKAMAAKRTSLVPNVGGRPSEVGDSDREEPRDDTEGRRYGLTEKKTLHVGNKQTRSARSYGWLGLTAS
jgi:hypothetical protein